MKRHWDEDQIESLAGAFVRLRAKQPFTPYTKLLKQAQEQCIVPLWKERIIALTDKAMHAEPPAPQIIEIPVEQPFDYVEWMARVDLPTLMGLAVKRLFAEGFAGPRPVNGPEPQPRPTKTAPDHGPVVPAPPVKPRPPCVAFCTGDSSLFAKLRNEVENNKIEVELRQVDLEQRRAQIPARADFVVFPKKSVGGPAWDAARAGWEKIGRVRVVENNLQAAVQEVYNIVSKKIRVPATFPAQVRA